jgi:multiple sugar transport system ATP-binding protein
MIAGLEDVTAGRILIGGRVVNDVAPKDRDVAMVFQNYALYPHMTVAENMGFSLKIRGERRDVIAKRVQEAAAVLGLEPYLARRPAQLSGGQRQRVAMGRSMVRAPKVFLFDEPLSNLDAQLRVQMRAELRDLHRRLGTTTVHVTHDQIEAMTLASTIVVLNNGAVEQVGAPLDLYDRPANRFVARFIGSPAMNLIETVIIEDGGSKWARAADGTRLPLPDSALVRAGARMTYGFRPEHLQLSLDGIAVAVASIEQTGAETHASFTLGADRIGGVFRDRVPLSPGDRAHLTVPMEHVHLFDGTTGERIGS